MEGIETPVILVVLHPNRGVSRCPDMEGIETAAIESRCLNRQCQ